MIAWPNGSGKSTLFQQIAIEVNTGVFINSDQIESQLSCSGLVDLSSFDLFVSAQHWDLFLKSSPAKSLLNKAKREGKRIDLVLSENFLVDKRKQSHSYESALAAMFIRSLLIDKHKPFSFETVMSHISKLEELRSAGSKGYRCYLYFVCTEDPLVNIGRIENRVAKGGHFVDSEKAKKRYFKSLTLLINAIKLCYRSFLFDNSGNEMKLIAETQENKLKILQDHTPNWFQQYVLKHYV